MYFVVFMFLYFIQLFEFIGTSLGDNLELTTLDRSLARLDRLGRRNMLGLMLGLSSGLGLGRLDHKLTDRLVDTSKIPRLDTGKGIGSKKSGESTTLIVDTKVDRMTLDKEVVLADVVIDQVVHLNVRELGLTIKTKELEKTVKHRVFGVETTHSRTLGSMRITRTLDTLLLTLTTLKNQNCLLYNSQTLVKVRPHSLEEIRNTKRGILRRLADIMMILAILLISRH